MQAAEPRSGGVDREARRRGLTLPAASPLRHVGYRRRDTSPAVASPCMGGENYVPGFSYGTFENIFLGSLLGSSITCGFRSQAMVDRLARS